MKRIIAVLVSFISITASAQVVGWTGPQQRIVKMRNWSGANNDSVMIREEGVDKYVALIHKRDLYGSNARSIFLYGTTAGNSLGITRENVVAIGYQALSSANQDYNIAIGRQAGLNSTGTQNVYIGTYRPGTNQASGDYNLVIGENRDVYSLTGSNQMNIAGVFFGNGVNETVGNNPSLGNVGVFVNNPLKRFHVNGTYRHENLGAVVGDSTTYKPLVINSAGDIVPFNRWAGAGGGGGTSGAPAHDSASITEINAGSPNNKFAAPLQLQGSEYEKRDGSKNYALTAGTATVLTAAFSPVFTTLTTGMSIIVKLHVTNSGSTTITVDGNAAKNIVKLSGTSIVNVVSNDLPINSIVELRYNGTQFQVVSFISDQLKGNLASTNTWAAAQTFTAAMQVNNTITSNSTITGNTISSNGGRVNTGSFATAYSAKTAAYTLLAPNDNAITADATTAAFNVTLPTAVGNSGLRFTVKRINSGANAVTLVTTSSQTIDGLSTYVLNRQNDVVTVMSDNANWRVVDTYFAGMWAYVTGGINAAGNVGINNATPSTALDVTGTIQASTLAGTNIGHLLVGSTGNISRYDGTYLSQSVSAAATLTLTNHDYYVFSGTTTTWTLPAASLSGNRAYIIKNRGSGNITLNSNSGSEIYTTVAAASTTIAPGASLTIICDGTFWGIN